MARSSEPRSSASSPSRSSADTTRWAPGTGPGARHGRRLGADDPRRQWIREFHRSLHEADEAEAQGTAGDAAPNTNPATAD